MAREQATPIVQRHAHSAWKHRKAADFRANLNVMLKVCGRPFNYRPARKPASALALHQAQLGVIWSAGPLNPAPAPRCCRQSLLWGKGGGVENSGSRAKGKIIPQLWRLGQQGLPARRSRRRPAPAGSALGGGSGGIGSADHGTGSRSSRGSLARFALAKPEINENHHARRPNAWSRHKTGPAPEWNHRQPRT